MKSLHKKIGAMVLAGMVVLGGVAVSGVSSFAASNEVAIKNVKQDAAYQKVEFFSKGFGKIIKVSRDEKEVRKIIKKDYKKPCNRGRIVQVKYPSQVALKVSQAKNAKNDVININYRGINYLIEIQ